MHCHCMPVGSDLRRSPVFSVRRGETGSSLHCVELRNRFRIALFTLCLTSVLHVPIISIMLHGGKKQRIVGETK